MSAIADPIAPPQSGGDGRGWQRRIRPAVDAVRDPSPRALLVGNARAGKSTALRRLRGLLDEAARQSVLVQGASTPIDQVPADQVLLVDDLHLLDERTLSALHERADDPATSLIVTTRPWPTPRLARGITRRLELRLPAVVLGHVSRSDLLDAAEEAGALLEPPCAEHILTVTGGVAWLVWEALRQHDPRDCADDPAHRELGRMLHDQIAHRLDTIDPALRAIIDEVCVAPATTTQDSSDDWALQGYAEGLLLRNGQPLPLVRAAVRATIPPHRLIDLYARHPEDLARELTDDAFPDGALSDLVTGARLGQAMVQHADRLLAVAPARASELYRGALACGVDAASLAVRRARAAWAEGDVDAAAEIAEDPRTSAQDDPEGLADITAAVWAARGMMDRADAVYRSTPPKDPITATHALIAGFAVGANDPLHCDAQVEAPSSLGVAMDLLRRGLRASAQDTSDEAPLVDLVRAAEMYTTAKAAGPLCELPAVIAAVVAVNLGALATAEGVIEDALARGHSGAWARPRLLLWRAFIAVQRGHPADAAEALQRAHTLGGHPSPRDALLAHSVRVALARRYQDSSGLEETWRQARSSILRADVDLYLLHPLSELICAAARIGDAARVQAQFAHALQLTAALGDPPLWTAHLRWAGIQEGILLSSPATLAPHAKALVGAAAHSRIAAVMAKAGRVWTSVLAGTVDADAVESAAEGLASIGLRWDAARLAGHGAARADDRKVSARLLACARELHPADGGRRSATATDDPARTSGGASSEEVLSERELEVARLVVQGKTYAEIGETIFISPRTAEHHIAHIRRRLGATSRSELLARLRVLLDDDSDGTDRRGDTAPPP